MGRPSPQTQAKRQREQAKKEKRQAKEKKRAARKAAKDSAGEVEAGEAD
ncbi:MAG TPA: hypothetical protein VMR74_06245 [Gammaproteobacteria bacterium]|nr:hypothetical protein [Gammaproteobacteria bacterium]